VTDSTTPKPDSEPYVQLEPVPASVPCLLKAMLAPVAFATSSFVSSWHAAVVVDPPDPVVDDEEVELLPDFEQAASNKTQTEPATAS
jgi:hypothetical protein